MNTLSHRPARLPVTNLFRGNPWRQLVRFPGGIPANITVRLLLANTPVADGPDLQPTLAPAGANTLLLGLDDTGELPSVLFLTLSWAGRVQCVGEVQTGRSPQAGLAGLPLWTITPGEAATLVIQTATIEAAEVLAEAQGLLVQVQTLLGGLNVDGALLTTLTTNTLAGAVAVTVPGVQVMRILADEEYDDTKGFYIRDGAELHRIRTAKR